MSDRTVIIIVSVLTLVVMCGILYLGAMWVPGRLDEIESRLDEVEAVGPAVKVLNDKQLEALEEIRSKVGRPQAERAETSAPLTRIDARVDEIYEHLKTITARVNEMSTNAATRNDVDKLSRSLAELEKKLTSKPGASPELKKLAGELAALRGEIKSSQTDVERDIEAVNKDLKQISLELQKLQALVKRAGEGS
jgi:chromosome segregation ATPase